jgi:excisionase family DNA binding protein
MRQINGTLKKPSGNSTVPLDSKLLISRQEAAQMLSISERGLDYLVANKHLSTRRIGSRVLIPVAELHRFARSDHPKPLAS